MTNEGVSFRRRVAEGPNLALSRRSVTFVLLCGLVASYFIGFGALSILKHRAFQTTALDMGNMDQIAWNTLHGRPFHYTNVEGTDTYLSRHLAPILLPVSLLYLIYSGPETLLLLQTLFVALGAVPLFLIARKRLGAEWAALSFAACYLLYPPMEGANLVDFHPVVLAPVFLLFAFYFMEERNYRLFLTFAVLAILCQEEMGLLVLAMGIYVFFTARERRVGFMAAILGLLWFLGAVFLVIPFWDHGGESPFINRYYGYLGVNAKEILSTALGKPWLLLGQILGGAKLAYLRDLLLPVAFTSLLSLPTFLLCLPSLAINLLSQSPLMGVLEGFHYPAPLVPFVFISSVYGISFLVERGKRFMPQRRAIYALSGLVLVFSLLYHRYHGYTPLSAGFELPEVTPHHQVAQEIMTLIPKDAAVSAQSRLNPHLSEREKIYMFPRIEDAEYIFFDVSVNSWPIHPNDQRRLFDSLLQQGFGVAASKDGYILLERGRTEKELSEDFYSFARGDKPQIEYPMTVDCGGFLRFLGFDLVQKDGLTNLALYWQALVPLERDYRIYPFFYDSEGHIIEDTSLRPMTVALWYPTSKWKVGEIVKMDTLPWDVGRNFNVGLGVTDGGDWSEMLSRLPLEVVTSTLVVVPTADNTTVRLMEVQNGKPIIR